MEPVSIAAKPVTIRYVAQVNQMRALIHDIQITRPPLLDKAIAQEWLSKIWPSAVGQVYLKLQEHPT